MVLVWIKEKETPPTCRYLLTIHNSNKSKIKVVVAGDCQTNGIRGQDLNHTHNNIMSRLPKHDIWIFMCRYRKMYSYFTLTAVQTRIILTILAHFSFFYIISLAHMKSV